MDMGNALRVDCENDEKEKRPDCGDKCFALIAIDLNRLHFQELD